MRRHTHESTNSAKPLSLDDRVCFAREFVAHVDGTDETHRFQTFSIYRDGLVYRYRKDLGPASNFPNALSDTRFVAGVPGTSAPAEYSVGEVLDILERQRYNIVVPDAHSDMRLSGKRTLLDDWVMELDERRQQRAHRTVIGPFVVVQRN